jgi:hypothetical protein
MRYLEEKATIAQEQFFNLLVFAQNNKEKDANYMEVEIFQRLLIIGKTLMEIYIDSVGTGDQGKHLEASNGIFYTNEGLREIIHTTLFGEVPIERAYYRKVLEQGLFPLDENINLPERTYSYLLKRFTLGVAVNESYAEARKYMFDLFGIKIPESSIQITSHESAVYFEEYYRNKKTLPVNDGELTVVLADGKGIPIKGEGSSEKKKRLGRGEKNGSKKMALVGTVYNVEPNFNRKEEDFKPKNKKIWAFLEQKERTMDLLRDDVDKRLSNASQQGDTLFIADGARGLWALKEKYFSEAVEILDWYHMTEYLWKAVYVFFKEGSSEAKEWVEKMEEKMIKGNVSEVIKGIRIRISINNIKGKKLTVLENVADYFENNKERMRYDEYVRKGYPIGSGNVESACRYLVKDRMEKTGMRWKFKGAQAILSLRALYLNGDLSDYWIYYMNKEHDRLYEKLDKCA